MCTTDDGRQEQATIDNLHSNAARESIRSVHIRTWIGYMYVLLEVRSGTNTIQLNMVNDAVCLMMQLQYNQQLRLKLLKEGVMK